jgi:membrane protein implicated in regulation of membrane protease activity
MCFCLFLIVFGAFGHMTKRWMTALPASILLLAACILSAGLCYWLLYYLVIKRLKENDASAVSLTDLIGQVGEVTLTIRAEAVGVISVTNNTGGYLSFRARIDPNLADKMPDSLPKGERVFVVGIDHSEKICYVSTAVNKFIQK